MNSLFALFAAVVVAVILFQIASAIVTAVNNLGQPVIARPAVVVGKRQHTSVHGRHNNLPASSSTSYYATFEFGHGEREELKVPSREYGLLAEGDTGVLHSQGTWFKGFERT